MPGRPSDCLDVPGLYAAPPAAVAKNDVFFNPRYRGLQRITAKRVISVDVDKRLDGSGLVTFGRAPAPRTVSNLAPLSEPSRDLRQRIPLAFSIMVSCAIREVCIGQE